MKTRGKILVIRGGAIGDFVLTLPVLAALRTHFPEARIEVLGYAHIAGLAEAGGCVDAVRSIEARALAGFFAREGVLASELQFYFRSFAVIISYLYDPDGIFQANVGRCSSAQFLAGPHRPDETLGIHATECLLKPLERLAIWNPDPVPRLPIGQPDPQLPAVLAIHPGSGSDRKNWPESKWAELLGRLMDQSRVHCLLVGGEAEGDRIDRLARQLPADRGRLARQLPLPRLAHELARCRAFVGHDSGISHLAAAVGLPGCALWGETSDVTWRPRSEAFRVVRHPAGLQALPVEDVFQALVPWLD